MNTPALSPGVSQGKPAFACVRCSERKVKCNKQNPCTACVRHNVQCNFRTPKPPQRRRKLSRNESLDERLKRYELLLQERGIDSSQSIDASQVQHHSRSSRSGVPQHIWRLPTASTDSEAQETLFKPLLLHGQRGTKFVDNSLWQMVVDEVQDHEEALEEESANHSRSSETHEDDFSYILDWRSPFRPSHPPTEHIHQLWQLFTENVDPLMKVVHLPTLQSALEKAAANVEHIPAGFEALMFAIYSLAVLSLTEHECTQLLGTTKAVLLPHYVTCTKKCLSRARFMSSTSLVVLQALVLHIFCIRDACNPRAVWNLTGVALRIAEGMGMCIDGTLLGLSPFETEIRRRIWWQLRMHDSRTAELAGQAKFRGFEEDGTIPKKPANVSDVDLYPAMPKAPPESIKPTEMMWGVLRSDLATFAHAQMTKLHKKGKSGLSSEEYAAWDDLELKDKYIKELEDMIETKHLRFCDPCQPLHFMALLGARIALNIIRFGAHHPRRWAKLEYVSTSERDFVWVIVIQLLEQYHMLQSSPQIRRFAWNVPYFIQWQAVIHVLDTLRADPLRLDAEKAWRLINDLYQDNPDMLLSMNKPIIVAVGNLCLRAYNARAAALTKQNMRLSDPPEYITKLRELRKSAKAKTDGVSASSKGKGSLAEAGPMRIDAGVKVNSKAAEAWAEAPRQQYSIARQPSNPFIGSTLTVDDAFWLNDTIDDGFVAGGAINTMDFNMDVTLADGYLLEDSNGEGIDWAQWDACFGKA